MSDDIIIEGSTYRRRRPLGVLVLVVVTCFVYWVVWLYKVNDEARRFLHDDSIKPYRSVLAVLPGVLLVVPLFLTVLGTGRRIRRMQEQAGSTLLVRPWVGVLCSVLTAITVLFAGGTGYYLQRHLNAAWDAATGSTGGPSSSAGKGGAQDSPESSDKAKGGLP